MALKRKQILLVAVVAIFTLLLVYEPHLSYPFPLHIDEWHHISQSIRLSNYGEYFRILQLETARKFDGIEIGFHAFLAVLSWVFNLVLAYRFLPAIWACLSGLALFYVAYNKTKNNFFIAILAMIFFASIKSNVNITGIWFFIPLTFSIPFIYLYIYFFSAGIEKENKTFLLLSLVIMALLVPTHFISLLFAVPMLLVYSLFNLPAIIKQYRFILIFLLIPVLGLFFYKYTLLLTWPELPTHIFSQLQFKYGWGVLELRNSFAETYSTIGYFLAIVGLIGVVATKQIRQYLIYLIWPITVFGFIILYRTTGISFFSPYQRNLYYLTLGLPILSALGVFYLINWLKWLGNLLPITEDEKNYLKKSIYVIVPIILIFTFKSYYYVPEQVALYHLIDNNDYKALKFLALMPPGKVMAWPDLSTAVFPISKNEPVASLVFAGNVNEVYNFFSASDCQTMREIINQQKVRYVITKNWQSECGLYSIYNQGIIIYMTNLLYKDDSVNQAAP